MITGKMFRDGIISASNNIANSRRSVDALNIFPVPDGDTGTNMSMTIGAAAKEMALLDDDCTVSEAASKCASALLRGARGNSGVILSLIFRGFSKGFKELESADAKAVAKALEKGVASAYKAVMKPTEGTILTVIRKASEAASEALSEDSDVLNICKIALDAAKQALEKTPEQLPVLKKAGVVDAGGQGLVLIFEGIASVLAGKGIIKSDENSAVETVNIPSKSAVASAQDDIEFGYCSEFLIERTKQTKNMDSLKLNAYLRSIGDCVVVVDDENLIKVHVHSNEPGNVIQEALKYGQLINIKIDNMRYQHKNAEVGVEDGGKLIQPTVAEPENDFGFVCVCAGEGVTELFTELGADTTVSGGQTMNPSTDDILNAVLATPAKTIFVLPNNKNIIMAAEQTIPLVKDRSVIVLPTTTIPQGISAMLMFDDSSSADDNRTAMMEAASNVETGSVTFAARDSEIDGKPIKKGQLMGLCNGKIKFIGDNISEVVYRTVNKLYDIEKHSLVTLIYGEGQSEKEARSIAQRIKEKYSDVEVTTVNGGQPIYYYIISVE